MTSSNSQIDKPQRERPKRAELPDVNISTGAQSINIERAFLMQGRQSLVIDRAKLNNITYYEDLGYEDDAG